MGWIRSETAAGRAPAAPACPRCRLLAALTMTVAAAAGVSAAQAQYPYPPAPSGPPVGRMASRTVMPPAPHPVLRERVTPQSAAQQYPGLSAPMYPCPLQNIPVQTGGTMYTNQALAPHEMMHAHQYRALYPPFYYRVKGSWIWTPFGIESHDRWELQGTEVKVNYRSNYSLSSLFFPPFR